jgi:hypothetical protein
MSQALTETAWLTTLQRVKTNADDDTTRTLAAILIDIIVNSDEPEVGLILDAYGARLLEES